MPVEESHENDEDDLASLTWQEIAERRRNIGTFESVIEELMVVEPDNEEDRLPDQLSEVANTIYHISSGIKSVRSHKEDFERLLGHASSLVVVFWESYNKLGIPGTMWPPPYLRKVIDRLVDTVYYIYKLMKRKSRKGFTKRTLVGYFGLRDLGKFKKYQRKLDYVASGFESAPNNADINGILLEIIENRAQRLLKDEDGEPSEEPATKKATADRSRLHKKNEAGDDEYIEDSKTAKMKTTGRQSDSKGTKDTNFDEKRTTRYQEFGEDVREDTSRQRSNDAQSKTWKRVSPVYEPASSRNQKPVSSIPFVEGGTPRQGSRPGKTNASQSRRVSSVYEDTEQDKEIPVVDSVASKSKKKKKKKPSSTFSSPPVSPQYSAISGFSFTNNAGTMTNMNIGNICNSTISDAYNDNSSNAFNGRRKLT